MHIPSKSSVLEEYVFVHACVEEVTEATGVDCKDELGKHGLWDGVLRYVVGDVTHDNLAQILHLAQRRTVHCSVAGVVKQPMDVCFFTE